MTIFSVQAYLFVTKSIVVQRGIPYLTLVTRKYSQVSALCSRCLRIVSDELFLFRIFYEMTTGSVVLCVLTCHVRDIEAF